ncbi:hypothetical protein BSL78_29389 [Apostichopus japonicus]|uniref:Uncharacterized protein n=1 Tax=Stichopus japonicus TaxID=307972 RepID=A0A2G8JDH5_STIJA|nr:hypothetical protein BSL78_29389 [Apostichopus japonicus]
MVYVVLVAGAIIMLLLTFLIGSLVGRRCSNTAPFPQALNTTEDVPAKDSPEYTLPTEETKDDMSHDYQDLSSKFDVSAKVIPRKQSEEEPSHTYQEITSKSDEPDYLIPSERSRDKPYHEYQDEATSNVQKEKMMLESHVQAKSLLGEVEQDDKSYEVPSALKKCTELYLNVAKGTKSKPIAQIEI